MEELVCIKKGPWVGSSLLGKREVSKTGPKYGEICKVEQSPIFPDSYIVYGYEFDEDRNFQSFSKKWFVPLEQWNNDLSESILEDILRQVEEENTVSV